MRRPWHLRAWFQVSSEEFLIVDNNLPTSRQFLRGYRKHVRLFLSIPVPYGSSIFSSRYGRNTLHGRMVSSSGV